MSRDILLGSTSRHWGRNGTTPDCGSMLPEGATGYAPTKWWTQAEAEVKIQELMKSGGIFGTSLTREAAERKTMAYLRKNLIGLMS